MSKRHMKLSDVEANKTYPFRGPATTFKKAYPSVESIRVEVRPQGEGFEPLYEEREWLDVYDENSFVSIIDCRNPRCYGGGLDLDRLIRGRVVEANRTEYEDVISCKGYEGSPKGRRKEGPCETRFKLKIRVKYK